jgi:hypothetical protein
VDWIKRNCGNWKEKQVGRAVEVVEKHVASGAVVLLFA